MTVINWVNVGNAANILQLLGAVHLVTVAKNFLRFSQNKKECRKLELRVETLEALIGWQTPCWSMVQQQQPWLEAQVSSALSEANALTNSYRKGTFWFLVRTGRSMNQQFRDQRNRIDSYCALIISVNACQLIAQAEPLTAPLLVRVEGGGATPTAAVPSRNAEVAADGVPAHNGVAADGVKVHNEAADDGQEAAEDRDQRVNVN